MGRREDVGRHRLRGVGLVWARRFEGWVDDRLPATLQGRVRIGGRELGVVLVVALLAVGAAACVGMRGAAAPAPSATFVHHPSASPSPSSPVARPSSSPEIVVDIAGKVAQPGVYRFPQGARVQDAIGRAGGLLPGVDIASVNQARLLADGEQLAIGIDPAPTPAGPAGAGGGRATGVVHLNSATQQQLEELPGVGPVMAQKILSWRATHGSFTKVTDLREVGGVGDKTFARLEPLLAL